MDFIDEITAFAKTIPNRAERISTEEGTKNALIMPFIGILGYDVFNPNEVNPEFTADVGTKKGEKVDYAIMKDEIPIILVECKPVNADLSKEHASQLFRYFTVAPARVGLLTNGIIYQFFTDLDSPNKMDDKPFLEINLLDIKEPLIEELKKFTKHGFNAEELDSTASQLRYTREIKIILNNEFSLPSEEFVKFLADKVYNKRFTQHVRDKFTIIIKDALSQFINEKINDRLKSAMETNNVNLPLHSEPEVSEKPQETDDIVTTEEETFAYNIVKAILNEIIPVSRVALRDAKTYCAVFLDNTNKKPICRFHFNTKQKYVAVFDNDERDGIKVPINDLNEIFSLSQNLKQTVTQYDTNPSFRKTSS